jgi:hypothetical protein
LKNESLHFCFLQILAEEEHQCTIAVFDNYFELTPFFSNFEEESLFLKTAPKIFYTSHASLFCNITQWFFKKMSFDELQNAKHFIADFVKHYSNQIYNHQKTSAAKNPTPLELVQKEQQIILHYFTKIQQSVSIQNKTSKKIPLPQIQREVQAFRIALPAFTSP